MGQRIILSLSLLTLAVAICTISAIMVRNHLFVYSKGENQFVTLFNDSQSKHLTAARKGAFQGAPLKNQDSLRTVPNHSLVRIHSCRTYKVAKLTHSVPYLTPQAKQELEAIAVDFNKKVKHKGLPNSRLLVTSLLRVSNDIEHLQQINSNAVTNSAHQYGTTFDISWSAYQCMSRNVDGSEYLKILAEVLKEHQKEKKALVKYETRQQCFHITSR